MSTEYFTATAARAATDAAQSLTGPYLRKETDEILQRIQVAAAQGKSDVSSAHTDPIVQQRLTQLGYKVKFTDAYDQRDSAYLTISW